MLTRFRVTERSDDRVEISYLKRRMTPEEREEFVRKIGEDYKEYLKSPERQKRLEEVTGKTEELRRLDSLKNAVSRIEDVGRSITDQYQYLLKTEEFEDFLSECSIFLEKIESRIGAGNKTGMKENRDCDSENLGD